MIPSHVGIIVDGNGRWATKKGLSRSQGHKAGADNLIKVCKYIFNKGVKVLSLYVFSTENFKRSEDEVNYLMDNLFVKIFKREVTTFNKMNVKVVFSGRRDKLKVNVLEVIDQMMEQTKNNTAGIINFCLNYGSHLEIIDAVKKIYFDCDTGKLNIDNIDEHIFNKYLYNDLPALDLVIRTGCELRLSNFMLWQASYAELYFTDVLFPDFNEKEVDISLESFSNRKRRFGGVDYEAKNN